MEQEKQLYLDKWIKSRALNKVPKVVPETFLSDKEFVIEAFKRIPMNFPLLQVLPPKTKTDKDVIMAAAKAYSINAFFAPKEALSDKELVLFLAPHITKKGYYGNYYFSASSFVLKFPPKMLEDREVRAAYLSRDATLLGEFFPKQWCDDREMAMLSVKKWGFGIHLLSQRLRDDKELVLTAIMNDECAGEHRSYVCEQSLLRYASERLRDDQDVVLAAVKQFGLGLFYASDRLKDDKEIAMAAVSHPNEKDKYDVEEKGCRVECSYNFVSPRLKADREVALEAVKNNPWAYYFAPAEIKEDFEIASIATNNFINPRLLKVPAALFDNKDFVLGTINNESIKYASPRLKSDKEVALAAIKAKPNSYQYLSFEMQKDKEIILLAARKGMGALYPAKANVKEKEGKYILEVEFKAADILRAANIIKAFSGFGTNREEQKQIVSAADELASHANHEDAAIEVEVDEDFIARAINPFDVSHYPEGILDNGELMLKSIKNNNDMLEKASGRLKDDKAFMLEVLKVNYYSVHHASARLKDDDEYMNKVVDKWNSLVKENNAPRVTPVGYASDRLKNNEDFVARILPLNKTSV